MLYIEFSYFTGQKSIARQEAIASVFYCRILCLLHRPEGCNGVVNWRGEQEDLEKESEVGRDNIEEPWHQLWRM